MADSSNMNSGILDLKARCVFFPVRHHSPACARLVRRLMREIKPSVVLIEGPSDYNPQLSELGLPHELPVAIYSWLNLPDGVRRGAFYPFCVYSPEWQALQMAKEIGAQARFIDLPWLALANFQTPSHRYADTELRRSDYIAALCHKLQVEDLDALWDKLFEIPQLEIAAFLERCHHFCFATRVADAHVPLEDLMREAFMAAHVRCALKETKGRVLVLTGGFHSYALYARLHGLPFDHSGTTFETDAELRPNVKEEDSQRGIALTPYSYERLDALTGYEAGMPSPGFYHRVWHDRQETKRKKIEGEHATARQVLAEAVKGLRARKQVASSADLIAIESTARALAQLRGHQEVWRRDLVDGILSSLVKEEVAEGTGHPFLAAVYEAMRGHERGRLAEGTSLPPLVRDLRDQLHRHDLEAATAERSVTLDLAAPSDLERSQVLHRLRVLGIVGYERTGGSDLAIRDDLARIHETWSIRWSPELEAACIEASIYGPSLTEAASARLMQGAAQAERNAELAALLLLDAALMGLGQIAAELFGRLVELIRGDADFFEVSRALGHLLYLFHFDETLGTTGLPDVGALLREAWERGLWLLEMLGQPQGMDKELLQGMGALIEVFERCHSALDLERDGFIVVLERLGQTGTHALLRGAATGALWTLGAAVATDALEGMRLFADPSKLGDYLTGLFSVAREAAQRHPALVVGIDELLVGYDDESFLEALPSLRLAFSFFTPREKHHMARTLLAAQEEHLAPLPDLEVDAATATRALAFETHVFGLLTRYGLRGGTPAGKEEA